MWGARTGGLRESRSIAFESRQTDILAPDTTAGTAEENYISQSYKETYFRLPPNKRTNYTKFSITSPFDCNWKLLSAEWLGRNVQDVVVLRNKNYLQHIQVINATIFLYSFSS